ADTSVFVPELVRRLKAEKESLKKNASAISQRRERWAKLHAEREENLTRELKKKWDEKPISTTRLYTEIAEAVKNEDWVLTNGTSQGKENLYMHRAQFKQILGKYQGRAHR